MVKSNKNLYQTILRGLAVLATLGLIASCGLGIDNSDRLARGKLAYDNGEFRAAIIDTKRILQDEPENAEARLLLGRASLRVGDVSAAAKELQKAVDLGVDKSAVVVDLGMAF